MKSLLATFVFFGALSIAKADVLMKCSVGEKDIRTVTVSRESGGLVLREIGTNGSVKESPLSQRDYDNKDIQLSDNEFGLRYLRYTYSEFFREFDWFVEAGWGSRYSISRGNCVTN